MPNPSIEGDVQGLAPLAAPHVKRYVLSLKQARFTETFFWLAASVVSN
uniref:Mobile element protein n=1 Tax=Vibrio alginolyticus TaxID=663 RepID=A0A2S1XW10_VIBAL|nr:Mobile element protein [Vibrio alginolyticus]